MEVLANARIVIWEGGSLWLIDATPSATRRTERTDPHAHHAIQIVLSLGGSFNLATSESHSVVHGVAVAADSEHSFAADGSIALLFVEPESRAGRTIAKRLFDGRDLAPVPNALLGDFPKQIGEAFRRGKTSDADFAEMGRALINHMSGSAAVDLIDYRIRKVIAWAVKQIDEPVTLADAVPLTNLSAARLRHLFVEQTGLPFKTYLLWLRLTRAVQSIAAGQPLTSAAHDAGFSDSAHLSRTFRRMFGVAPTSLKIS